MVLHFSHVQAHKYGVLSLYRDLIRKARFVSQDESVSGLFTEIFRRHKVDLRSHRIRSLLLQGEVVNEKLSNMVINGATPQGIADLISSIKLILAPAATTKLEKPISNPVCSDTEVQDIQARNSQRQKLNDWLQKEVKNKRKENLMSTKTPPDPVYLKEITQPEVLFKLRVQAIEKLKTTLQKGPAQAKIAYKSGLKYPAYMIRVPWGGLWRERRFLYKAMLETDRLNEETTQLSNNKSLMKKYYDMENQWDRLMGHSDGDWLSVFRIAEKEINAQSSKLVSDIKNYNKRQVQISHLTQEQLDAYYEARKANFTQLVKELKNYQLDPHYTDIDLGELLEVYNFKSPTKLPLLGIN
ncbi:BA75_04890T0 [Komagataella pastoris]|uniref:BA75_04890T0 n=1 Tax=Komagataella pastoris TaxID=4922 RepID=A0A1B2JHR5_PICPA|nr:BA75_04890T0 [Komagataella pastoris]